MNNNEIIIFESKTTHGYNIIVEKEDCYVLRAKKGEAIFDKKRAVLKAVIHTIQQYGNAKWSNSKGCGFRFQDKNYNLICTLGQVVYCAYYKLSLTDLLGRQLRYADGNPFNLRKENIAQPHKQTFENISIFGEPCILLRAETENHECHYAVVDDNPKLLDILSTFAWQFHEDGRCLRAIVNKKRVKLHHAVWACHHNANITKENLFEKVAELQAQMGAANLSIDHKKASITGERWDNRLQNLQLIPANLNAAKNNSTARLHNNLFYIPTTNGEMYGRYDWTNGYIDFCENTGEPTVASIDQLRRFSKTGEFEITDTHCQIPLGSPKAAEIQLADLHETKLYSEVLIYEH